MAHKQIGKSHQSLVGVECYKDKQRLIGNAVEIEILNRVVREAFLEDDIQVSHLMWLSGEKGKPGGNDTSGKFKGNMENSVAEYVGG